MPSFSRGLKEIKSRYTNHYNRHLDREGPIWKERFRSLTIEDERYLLACGLYIESNPVKAGMVEQAEDWPYSSARHYLPGETDRLIEPYENQGLPPAKDLSDSGVFTKGSVIGSEMFRIQTRQGAFHA